MNEQPELSPEEDRRAHAVNIAMEFFDGKSPTQQEFILFCAAIDGFLKGNADVRAH